MQELTKVQAVGIDPRVYGSLQQRIQKKADHGPYYAFSPGEPIHRVDCHDSVPHIYPMRVATVTSWGSWEPIKHATGNVTDFAENADGEKMYLNPTYAGVINASIVGNYSRLGVISIDAFAGYDPEAIQIDLFNSLILPHPVWFGTDDVPHTDRAWYDSNLKKVKDLVKEAGCGLNLRERFLTAAAESPKIPARLQDVYLAAIIQCQTAVARFRRFADLYLAEQDRDVRDTNSEKGTYDDRDARLQWLTGRAAVDQFQPQQQVVVQQQPTDVAGIVAAVMAALEARNQQVPQAQVETVVAALATEETPLEKKQRELREKNSK